MQIGKGPGAGNGFRRYGGIFLVCAFVIVVVMFFTGECFGSDDYPGVIVNTRGRVTFLAGLANGWDSRPALRLIQCEDRLRTFENAAADIVFENGETVSVASETSFVLMSTHRNDAIRPTSIEGRLDMGRARARASADSDIKSEISIETSRIRVVGIGVFDFDVAVLATGTEIVVNSGVVRAHRTVGFGAVELGENQRVRISDGPGTPTPERMESTAMEALRREWENVGEGAATEPEAQTGRMTTSRAVFYLLSEKAGLLTDESEAFRKAFDAGVLTDNQAIKMVAGVMRGASSTLIAEILNSVTVKAIPKGQWDEMAKSVSTDVSDGNIKKVLAQLWRLPDKNPPIEETQAVIGLASIAPPEERARLLNMVVAPVMSPRPMLSFISKPQSSHAGATATATTGVKTNNPKPSPAYLTDAAKKGALSAAEFNILLKAYRNGAGDDYLRKVIVTVGQRPLDAKTRSLLLNAVAGGMKKSDFDAIAWAIKARRWSKRQIEDEINARTLPQKKKPLTVTQPQKTDVNKK